VNYDHELIVRLIGALWRVIEMSGGRKNPMTCRNFGSYDEAIDFARQQALRLAANDGDAAVVLQSADARRIVWSSRLSG
jgi:hypothetical protein